MEQVAFCARIIQSRLFSLVVFRQVTKKAYPWLPYLHLCRHLIWKQGALRARFSRPDSMAGAFHMKMAHFPASSFLLSVGLVGYICFLPLSPSQSSFLTFEKAMIPPQKTPKRGENEVTGVMGYPGIRIRNFWQLRTIGRRLLGVHCIYFELHFRTPPLPFSCLKLEQSRTIHNDL